MTVPKFQLSRHPNSVSLQLVVFIQVEELLPSEQTLHTEQYEYHFLFWECGKIRSSGKRRSHTTSLLHKINLSLPLSLLHALLFKLHFLLRLILPWTVLVGTSHWMPPLFMLSLFLYRVRENMQVSVIPDWGCYICQGRGEGAGGFQKQPDRTLAMATFWVHKTFNSRLALQYW